MRKHWAAAIAACIAICSVDFVRAQGPDWGKNEYLTACQPCHGKDGKGDGSTASHLARAAGRSDEAVGIKRRRVSIRASFRDDRWPPRCRDAWSEGDAGMGGPLQT
jgi:mono/diheme cytochrome c family protein